MNSISNVDNDKFEMLEMLSKFSKEELEKLVESKTNSSQQNKIELLIDLKKEYIDNQFKYTNINNICGTINCQCIRFVYDKMLANIKKLIILGLIQCGKTKEILGLIHFFILYLKIPVIVLIQNRTSGYKQLEDRIMNYCKELENNNIKSRYVKTGFNVKSAKKIFNYDKPCPEVLICLSNYKQLEKLKNGIDSVTLDNNPKGLIPYVVILDEYDDHIKSRLDIDNEKELKIVEKSTKVIKEHAYLEIGVTATLLASMFTDEKTNVNDIYQLTPPENYIGFGSNKIKICDIKDLIIENNNKRELHISFLMNLLEQIDNSVNSENKDYTITLINITDNTRLHKEIYGEIQNELIEWSCILFNSNNSNSDISCSLPSATFSKRCIKPNTYISNDGKQTIRINEEKVKTELKMINGEQYFSRYSISFENYSISEVISELLTYTDKIAIVSGRMACRGISFVTTDYSKHITDMIYVPSGSSHLTRNVQDMRIYGVFPDDGLDINLYIDKEVYIADIGGYITLQKKLLDGDFSEENDGSSSINLRQRIMNYDFDPEEIPEKKIDRTRIVKGLGFKKEDKWGIPTNITNIDMCVKEIADRNPEYNITIYSKYLELDISNITTNQLSGKFIVPTKENLMGNIYKQLFRGHYKNKIEQLIRTYPGCNNYSFDSFKQWYILNNYRNGWPLHNPLTKIEYEPKDLCYMGNNGDSLISIIVKNPLLTVEKLKEKIGEKEIIIFYSRDCYHYTKCDEESYYIYDKLK